VPHRLRDFREKTYRYPTGWCRLHQRWL